jgi:hypothetical protein
LASNIIIREPFSDRLHDGVDGGGPEVLLTDLLDDRHNFFFSFGGETFLDLNFYIWTLSWILRWEPTVQLNGN